ncbi:MAG TPA: hypothetical protein VEU33_34105 [Archangium sp.]|nr:hypothetical protein [Archangium sp.]
MLDGQAGELLTWLANLRVAADYVLDDVTVEMVREALEMATGLVRRLLGEEPIL